MRKKIVAGNWKMNTTLPDGKKLINEVTLFNLVILLATGSDL